MINFFRRIRLAMSILARLVDAVESFGGTEEDVYRLATGEGGKRINQIARLIIDRKSFRVVVDYDMRLQDAIVAGEYACVDEDITEEHFPAEGEQGKEEQSFRLFSIDKKDESYKGVMREISRSGYRLATIRELLAFGKANPKLQWHYSIVGLGSTWVDDHGQRKAAHLWGHNGRYLSLNRFEEDWFKEDCLQTVENIRFLVVKK